jgi:hypothetical protein
METPQSLVAAVERAIDEADPIGLLEDGAPADEYATEIGTIVSRVLNAHSVEEVTTVIHEEFVRWFGDETAGPRKRTKLQRARSGRLYSNSEGALDAELLVRLPSEGAGAAAATRRSGSNRALFWSITLLLPDYAHSDAAG